MANIVLPTFPALAAGALFVKGVANNGSAASVAQYATFGHSFQIEEFPNGSGLAADFGAGALPCQVDVKTRYADGSAAHALITVLVPTVGAGTTVWGQFSLAGAPGGQPLDLATALGSTTLVLTVSSMAPAGTLTKDLIALVKAAAPDLWLSGPLAVQGRALEVLHKTARIQVDITAYADGTVLADVMLANDVATFLETGSATNGPHYQYHATLTLNGSAAYTSPEVVHYLYENWTARVGTNPASVQIVHDPNDFIAAQAVQSYNTTLGVDPGNLTAANGYVTAKGFGEPLTNPSYNGATLVDYQMGDVGGRADIGINDAWCAWWFITQNPDFYAVAMECAKVNGGIPWHYWNHSTGQYVTTNDYPYLWTNAPSYQSAGPGYLTLLQEYSTDPNWQLDLAHFPELVYLQYLLTGRRYYLDELNAVFSWVEVGNWSAAQQRNFGQGLFVQGGQLRQCAWGLRNALYATYANPDGTAPKLYARQMLDNNLYWLLTQMGQWQAIQGEECFGWMPPWSYGALRANWEQNYFFSSVSMAAIMGHPAALQFSQWMANFLVGIWNQSSNGFPTVDAVAYENGAFQTFGQSPGTGTDYAWGGPTLPAQTWAAIESLTQQFGYSVVGANGKSNFETNAGGSAQGDYGQLFWISLANLQTLQAPGAAAALATLQTLKDSAGNPVPFIDDGSWAIGPLVMVMPRTLNASQIFPNAGQPAAIPVNATVLVDPIIATAS